jgi:hypothetical protein
MRWQCRVPWPVLPCGADLTEELLIGDDGLVEPQLKGVLGVQRGECAAQADHGGVLGGSHEQVLAAGTGRHRVDRREHPLLRQVAAIFGHPDITGDYLLDLADWARHAGQNLDSAVFVKASPGESASTVRATVAAA